MGMNEAELALVVGALQDLVGSRLGGIWQPRRDRIVLGVGSSLLLLVPRGPFARLHTIASRPRNPRSPYSFQGACRAHLSGALTRIDKVEGDRIVDLHFGAVRLHLRLTGRGGGLWLAEGDTVHAAYDGPAPDALPELPDLPPLGSRPRFELREGETWDLAARRWFGEQEAHHAREARRANVRRGLRKALQRASRLAEALGRDLDRASTAPGVRRQADALAARLHTVSRGTTEVEVPDLEDPEVVHRIPLEPGRPPSWSLDKLYARARRLDRVGERVLEQLDRVETEIAQLRDGLERVDTADDRTLDALSSLVPRSAKGPDRVASVPWNTWAGPSGERVLVGRNAKVNRRLTFQVARGEDFWMHVRGRPGAHLILPVKRGHTPTLEHLLAAAQIALIQAGVPEGGAADVQYTRVKHVRSIPGEVGLVQVLDEKVMHVTRDPSQLVGWTRES